MEAKTGGHAKEERKEGTNERRIDRRDARVSLVRAATKILGV